MGDELQLFRIPFLIHINFLQRQDLKKSVIRNLIEGWICTTGIKRIRIGNTGWLALCTAMLYLGAHFA